MAKENIFDEVDKLKERVKKEILTNQEILKLISINHDNPLSKPDIVGAGSLVDKCIYFKPRVFGQTINETQCFLMTDIIIASIRNSIKFADIKLIFRIMVHNTLFELHDDKTRAYQIAKRLVDSFSGASGTWMGKCSFETCNPIECPTDYQAIQLVFNVTDFKS